jgi:chromosome partition protein MukB
MKLFRAHAKRLVLANWKGIIFHSFDLDRHVTGLEGQNGSGKTTVMAAYVTAILPNQRLLSFTNNNSGALAARGDGGLWGRLGGEGISYALIEWITPRGQSLWAGVAMTRGAMPSIDIKTITIHDLPADASPYDILLLREMTGAVVPSLPQLREHIAMHGGRLAVHKSLADYMKLLFEQGITPMPMTTHEEQERFYRVLSTSMEGSALATLIKTGLRDYLLSPDASLERRVSLMRESLEQCRQTKRELERAQAAHAEISGLFDAAWKMSSYAYFGARGRYEQETRLWKDQVLATRNLTRQYIADQAKVAQLLQRTAELKRELSAAQVAAENRKLELQNVEKAQLLRIQLERAQKEHATMQQCAEEACGRCGRAEEAEQQAVRALQHAQDEHVRIAGELADTQKAVEGLIRRVTELHVARTLLADAQEAMKPSGLDSKNAAAMKLQVGRQYEDKTHRQTEAQAELDALSHHIQRFDDLLEKLQCLARLENCEEPNAASAYGQALALETKLREQGAQAERISGLQSELAHARAAARQQAEARSLARDLGIDSSKALSESLAAADARLEQLEGEQAGAETEMSEAQDALVDAKGRLPALEDLARRYDDAHNCREGLAALSPEWAASTELASLLAAVEVGRRDLSGTEERRRTAESSLRETSDHITSLEHYSGLLDPRLGTVAAHVDGHLLASRFDDLHADDAAQTEARLGMWTQAIVVVAPEHAARQAAELYDRPDNLLFVSEQALVATGEVAGLEDSVVVAETVHGEYAARLTRKPQHPVLGRHAREKEIARLRTVRDHLESELGELREQSRILRESLLLAERLLSLGPVAWLPDPRPALLAEQVNARSLTQVILGCQARMFCIGETTAAVRRHRQRMAGLESWRSLLNPPDHAERVEHLEVQLETARGAQAWLGLHAGVVRQILDGLPILANVVEAGRREQLEQVLDGYRRERDRLAYQREALTKLLSVIEHLDRDEEERTYYEKNSVITALQEKLEPARDQMKVAEAMLQTRRGEFDAARTAHSQASAALIHASEKCKALDGELVRSGVLGTDEEVGLARQAYSVASASSSRLGAEYEETNNSFIEQRTCLKSLDEKLREQTQAAAHQLSAVRNERRAQRELDQVVGQLGLRRKIDSDLNRQHHFPTGSQINAFQSSQSQQVLLLDRLRPWPAVLLDLKRIDGFDEPSGERRAVQTLRAWDRIRRHIEQRIPRNIANADDPQIALAQMSEKMSELQHTLAAQEEDMRSRSSGLADGVAARQRSARSLVIRLNRELEQVHFGSIRGLQITLSYPDDMAKMLACLRRDSSLSLFDSGLPLEETLAQLYQRETSGTIRGALLFDYRNYLQLRLEVKRINGKWEATSEVSTGEAIGAGAAVLVMILRTWNEEANRISGAAGYAMQQILLDEASRLDAQALDTLTEFCQRMDVQAMVAAPGLDKPRCSTVFQLSRALRGQDEFVTIRGTRISA